MKWINVLMCYNIYNIMKYRIPNDLSERKGETTFFNFHPSICVLLRWDMPISQLGNYEMIESFPGTGWIFSLHDLYQISWSMSNCVAMNRIPLWYGSIEANKIKKKLAQTS